MTRKLDAMHRRCIAKIHMSQLSAITGSCELQNTITKPPFPNSQKIIVKPPKAMHLQTYVNSRVLNLLFLKSLLKSRFTNLCKFPCLKSAVLKIAVKIEIYKPM